jgi:hypothetical protein
LWKWLSQDWVALDDRGQNGLRRPGNNQVKRDGEASNDEEIVEMDVRNNVREMKADKTLVALASEESVKDGISPAPSLPDESRTSATTR